MQLKEAIEKILAFVNANPGVRTSEIICELGIEPKLAIQVLEKLHHEGLIK